MKKILIANRGEIARRVIRTCRLMGIQTVAVASEADEFAVHVREADEFCIIGPAASTESYLKIDRVIQAALDKGADAIHPGYGFLSENAEFARAVAEAGLQFIGPKPETISLMGSKRASKIRMKEAGVPVIPGYEGPEQDAERLAEEAEKIGFPVLIKASAGGGGKGMRVVREKAHFSKACSAARNEARNSFGDDTVILEKYIEQPRHIEFQVFGDGKGNAVHLFERECSVQRRHQKIIEETPSPALNDSLRQKMAEAARLAASSVNYLNAGTVEFILAPDQSFYFLEMNTRLQVEHPVTEMTTGQDLVRWQIYITENGCFPFEQDQLHIHGHAFEARIYAEDPENNFFPQTGKVVTYCEPNGSFTRMDSGITAGCDVSVYYDPMLAKLITFGACREEARQKMAHALGQTCIHGVKTNLSFLKDVFREPVFRSGEFHTGYIDEVFPDYKMNDDLLDSALGLSLIRSKQTMGKTREVVKGPWQRLGTWRASK
ncbi:MAG: pyruvate carboxylase subunit A [Acidobacteria bacterium]|nr:MAG: pyruvate carboxylase subunit A [Acidobacteriota bacterium]